MTTESVFYMIVSYVLVFFINRWIYLQIQKLDTTYYPNPPAVFACFMYVIGTGVLGVIWLLVGTSEFFKYKK